jgi:hypothetical protein
MASDELANGNAAPESEEVLSFQMWRILRRNYRAGFELRTLRSKGHLKLCWREVDLNRQLNYKKKYHVFFFFAVAKF